VADAPRVSVIIPTYQRRVALRRALLSLARQTVAAESYEVIVSVDGSTDGTSEMLSTFDASFALRTVAGEQRGRASACNAGIVLARGDVLIILDDDMQVVPEFVERHRRHHPRGSRLCVLGAVPVELDGSSPHAARYVQASFDTHLARLPQEDHLYLPRSFYTGNASLRAQVLREVGDFDESFTVYGNEDVELALRLRAGGVKLRYDPEALAYQEYSKDLRGLARDTLAKGGSTVALARAHPEVFEALRLAAPRDSSRPWLAARAILLWLTRRWSGVVAAVFALAALLERLGLWRQPLFYRASLDYAFWAGVDAELRGSTDKGELARLEAELHRDPIDLLLHG
jgi:glycosyltransferase involved in cell wall biosynthesis